MDIVYIIKEEEHNTDLKYSLRTVEKNITEYDRLWIAGYKPSWVSDNVGWIRTKQYQNKWQNSFFNVVSACQEEEVSDDFVLFNDDFFILQKTNLETDINYCKGTLDEAIEKYRLKVRTRWIKAHKETKELLIRIGSEHFMNFALHIPMRVNKEKFLSLSEREEIKEHIEKYQILSYRSVYGNLDWRNPERMKDCKPKKGKDATEEDISGRFLSVFDGVTDNLDNFPNIKKALLPYEEKSSFEK